MEMISINKEDEKQIQDDLKIVRDFLLTVKNQKNTINPTHIEPVSLTPREQAIQEMQNYMNNQKAIDYIVRILPDNFPQISKLSEIVKALANLSNTAFTPNQFKTFQGIYQWVDNFWENIEPFASELMIIDCSTKHSYEDDF